MAATGLGSRSWWGVGRPVGLFSGPEPGKVRAVPRTQILLNGLALALTVAAVGILVVYHGQGAPTLVAAQVTTTSAPPETTTADTTPADTTTIPATTVAPAVVAVPSPAPAATTPCVADPPPAIPATSQLASPRVAGLGYSSSPGGPVTGHLPATSWGNRTVRPVVSEQAGWLEVRLDTRPNASTGWIRQQDAVVTETTYAIVISTCQRTLTLFQQGQPIYSTPVGVGRASSPTPLGPSFVDAIVATPRSQRSVYGPTVLITASHSNVYTEFDGGNGTVAIHGYPSDPASTRGVASSHGCVRVSPQTISALSTIPVGSPIDIIA